MGGIGLRPSYTTAIAWAFLSSVTILMSKRYSVRVLYLFEAVTVARFESALPVTKLIHLWNAIEEGPLKIQFHHDAKSTGETCIHADGKIEGTDLATLNKPSEGRQRLTISVIGIGYRVVALGRRAECPLHVRVVV